MSKVNYTLRYSATLTVTGLRPYSPCRWQERWKQKLLRVESTASLALTVGKLVTESLLPNEYLQTNALGH